MEQKIQFIEQFANETAEKYQELASQQHSRQQIEELKEKNKQLKNVSNSFNFVLEGSKLILFSFFFFKQKILHLQDANKENETSFNELKEKLHSGNERTPLKVNLSLSNIQPNTPRTPKTPKTPGLGNKSPAPALIMSPLLMRNN